MRNLLFVCLTLFCPTVAALDVVVNTGKTIPVPSELYLFDPAKVKETVERVRVVDQEIAVRYEDLFPIETPRLSLGHVQPRAHAQPLSFVQRTLFFLGCDRTSTEWLLSRKEYLEKVNAHGMVVSCGSLSLYRHLVAAFPTLTLVPASVEDLAASYNLNHYPAIITAEGITQ